MKDQCGHELNLLSDTAPSRALVYVDMCLWVEEKEWSKVQNCIYTKHSMNVNRHFNDKKRTHTSIQNHDLADIFRSVFDIWWANSYAYIYSNQFKTFLKRMICQDFLPVLDSRIFGILCAIVLNGLYRTKQWCCSHTVICRATQSVRRCFFSVALGLFLWDYEDCETLSNSVFENQQHRRQANNLFYRNNYLSQADYFYLYFYRKDVKNSFEMSETNFGWQNKLVRYWISASDP